MKKNEEVKAGIQKIEGLIIRKESPYFESFRFLTGARSKDETRPFMSGFHVEHINGKTVVISTDGRRLHIANFDGVEIDEGEYQIKDTSRDFFILYPQDEELQFPDWRRIIKGLENKKHFTLDMAPRGKNRNDIYSQNLNNIYKLTGAVINMDYTDALRGRTWDIHFKEPELITRNEGMPNEETTVKYSAVTFISGNLLAIIMPMDSGEEIEVTESETGPDFRDITPDVKVLEFKKSRTEKKSRAKKTA